MSQFWHAHWAEDSFKPASLRNWEVPNWHPKFPCRRHCVTTTFLADASGRLLPDKPRSKRSPWGDFKGTWELPLKIDRKLAWKLSAPPKYKQGAWEAHKIRYQGSCGANVVSPRKMERRAKVKKTEGRGTARAAKPVDRVQDSVAKSGRIAERNLRSTLPKKPGKNVTQKEPIENVNRVEHKKDETGVAQEQRVDEVDRKERKVDEKKLAQEQPVEKFDREEHREKKKSNCLCVNKSDSRSPVEVTPKPIRKNYCTVHQRLRV